MHDMLSRADALTIIATLLAVAVAGFIGARRQNGESQGFILAGRALTMPVFVASLVATWYGSVLGATEFIVTYGVVFFLCFGIPYYLIALVYARWLAGRVRQSQAMSIPDQIRRTYGDRASQIVAMMMLVITIPASYQLSLALIAQTFTGWSLEISLLTTSAFAFAYVAKGGLRSDAYANVVQALVMFAGYIACVIACMITLGSPLWLLQNTSQEVLAIPGRLGWTPIVVWFVIALQTFIDPNFHVRTAAARDVSTARRGIVVSVGLWIVFDTLQVFVGLYALQLAGAEHGAQSALNLAVTVLPDVWRGLFVAGTIAAVMSALDGYALASGTIIGHDLSAAHGTTAALLSVRSGVALSLGIGAVAALAVPSVIDLIYRAASIAVPAVLAPLLISFSPLAQRVRKTVVWLILIPACASIGTMVLRNYGLLDHTLAEPMLIGIVVSAVVVLLALRVHEPATEQ